ncbi:MAG: hypothetical protein ACYSWT_01300 [Planctomycetota bacterium]
MERYLAQIAFFAAAGALAAVAVAWACAAWSSQHARGTVPAAYGRKPHGSIEEPTADDLARLKANGYPAPDARTPPPLGTDLPVGVIESVGLGIDHRCLCRIAPGLGPTRVLGCSVRAGWPARCLGGLHWHNPPDAGRVQSGFWGPPVPERVGSEQWLYVDACALPGRVGPFRFGPQRTLPLRPLWWGLILDVAAWAALLWLVTLGPFELRRIARQARGRCLHCGYDLRGDGRGGCPECGWSRDA